MRGEVAAKRVESAPYSLLTNLAHAVYWQGLWLRRLTGGRYDPKVTPWKKDWRDPDVAEWPDLRDEFVAGFAEARRIAESDPFDHAMGSDAKATEILLRIATHASYHLGQINLLKQLARST